MATLEDQIKDLKEKNNELVQKVQYWKMTAAQKEDDRIALLKENNELRLKLSRLRNSGGLQARKLDTALQAASEEALSLLVKASAEIVKSMDIAKAYMRDRQELDALSPRWSTLSTTPGSEKKDKIHRVPPMMLGGQSIQPVVALSRTLLNTNNPLTTSRTPNQNRNITERAVPMHMLQDVYIPLTRIDASELQTNNIETETDTNNAEDSTEELGLDDSGEILEDAQPMSDEDDFEGRRLDAVTEDLEPEEDVQTPLKYNTLNRQENPLEGPSWLLDTPGYSDTNKSGTRTNLEPDSTTEMEDSAHRTPENMDRTREDNAEVPVRMSCEFSPTVRRRKRTSSPGSPRQHHYSPRPLSSRRNSTSGRVLKVLVAKMRLDGEGAAGDAAPPKRARSPPPRASPPPAAPRVCDVTRVPFDAPSPNGATDSAVIVLESRLPPKDKETNSTPRTADRRESRETQHNRATYNQIGQHSRNPSFESQPVRTDVQSRLASSERRESRMLSCDSRQESRVSESRDSDSGSGGGGDSVCEGRTRRPRKMVTYKEKPLNRKLRR